LGTLFVGRPLSRLLEKVRTVGTEQYGGPVQVWQRDEIGELADEMNKMAQRLASAQEQASSEHEAHIQTLEQLRHADRLASIGRLAAGIAHELGTPLNVISGRSKLIWQGKVAPDAVLNNSRIIFEQSQRITAIVQQLMTFSRRRTGERNAVDLARVVTQVVELLQPLSRKRNVSLRTVTSNKIIVTADAHQLEQVLLNLVVNAIQASSESGEVLIALHQVANEAGSGIVGPVHIARVSVCDRGPGISKETMSRIFEPFFTTKDVGEGTGLGLSVAYGIVEEYGGTIRVVSEPGAGAEFVVCLPLAKEQETKEMSGAA
jgi:signal transduction histidine kinase